MLKQVDLKKSSPNRKLVGGLFVITGILSGAFWLKGGHQDWEALKYTYKVEDKKTDSSRDVSRSTAQLLGQLQKQIATGSGTYGMYVYRLTENKGYGFNEQLVMPAASIMKVPIMASVFKAIENGKLNLDDSYAVQSADKRSGSGPIEYMGSGTRLTVKRLMEEMGKKSDNTAPIVLSRLVGQENVEKTISDLGMVNTSFDDNTTTAADVTSAWKSLYQDHYLTDEHLELMWSFLQDSIYEDRIPLGLPEEIEIVHKVGTDSDIWADAGIILTEKPFVLVILNREVKLDEAKTLVPAITKTVWEYESTRVSK
jgi:beta-lactamase class A